MNILDQIGQIEMNKTLAQRDIPVFGAGDTVRIDVKVVKAHANVFRLLKGFALPVNPMELIHHLLFARFLMAKVLNVSSRYIPRVCPALRLFVVVKSGVQNCITCVDAQVRRHELWKAHAIAISLPLKGLKLPLLPNFWRFLLTLFPYNRHYHVDGSIDRRT